MNFVWLNILDEFRMIELDVFRKIEYILYRLPSVNYLLFYILYIKINTPMCQVCTDK